MVLLPHKQSHEKINPRHIPETLSERTRDALRDTGREVLRIVNIPEQLHTASLRFEGRHALTPDNLDQTTPFELGLDVQRLPLRHHHPRHSVEDPSLIPAPLLQETATRQWEGIADNPDFLFTHPTLLSHGAIKKTK